MKIEVLQEDIDNAIDNACRLSSTADKCPIALAIKRQTGKKALVSYDIIVICELTNQSKYNTPEVAADFMDLFDRGSMKIAPFSFELDTTEVSKDY